MKKGILVTENNLATIFGHVRKIIEGKTLRVESRRVFTKSLNKLNRVLGDISLDSYHKRENGKIIASGRFVFFPISTTIDENILSFQEKYIAVRDCRKFGGLIINLGDKVLLSKGRILIYKYQQYPSDARNHIEVFQF